LPKHLFYLLFALTTAAAQAQPQPPAGPLYDPQGRAIPHDGIREPEEAPKPAKASTKKKAKATKAAPAAEAKPAKSSKKIKTAKATKPTSKTSSKTAAKPSGKKKATH